MRALAYLIITQIKNRILSLKKKPGLLILYSIVFVAIAASIIIMFAFGSDMEQMQFADERILLAILAGVSILFLYLFVVSGLSTGSSLFTMPDVGLLFVAPISSKKILLYGLISTLGKAMIGSLFIFYQVTNLKSNFGYGFREIFALFFIFTLMMLFYQLLAIGIYIFSNGNPARKNIVKGLMYAVIAIVLLGVLFYKRQEQSGIFEAVLMTVEADWFGYLPVTGWSVMFFSGIIHYSMPSIALAMGFFFVFGSLIVALLTSGRADYYEDVLLSTEVTYQTKQAAKEGKRVPSQGRKKIKVRDNEQGIGYGTGASSIMYKHILEMKRKSKFIFIDNYTVILTIGAGFTGYNLRAKEELELMSYVILAAAIYMQYFMTMAGRLSFELNKPYIFMIPEKSIHKVLAASATSLIKPCIDGLIAFICFAIISGAGLLTGFFFALAYAASGSVFIGITILYQRVLGAQPNRLVRAFIGIGLLLAIMGPSIGVSVVAAFMLPAALQFMSVLPYTIFCAMFAAILFLTCGNLIDKAEFTGKA